MAPVSVAVNELFSCADPHCLFFLLQTLGFNIEEMDKYFPIKNFDAVYLIDLCQPCVPSSSIPLRVDSS